MVHYVYILENEQGRHYVGHTHQDVEQRLCEHNEGKCPWTKIRERQIKRYKGGRALKALLK